MKNKARLVLMFIVGSLARASATFIVAGNVPDIGVTVSHWLTGGVTVIAVAFDPAPLMAATVNVCAAGMAIAFVTCTKDKPAGVILKGEVPAV